MFHSLQNLVLHKEVKLRYFFKNSMSYLKIEKLRGSEGLLNPCLACLTKGIGKIDLATSNSQLLFFVLISFFSRSNVVIERKNRCANP